MNSTFRVIAVVLFICRFCYPQALTLNAQVPSITTATSSLKLQDSTPVMLRTKQGLSSSKAKVGDRVPFRVIKDVKVTDDLIVIRRGADAWGLVTSVQRTRRKGRPGNLSIAIQSVQLLTGETAQLRAEQHLSGESRLVGTMADIPQAAIETFGVGIPIVFLSMLEKGKDAYLPVGTEFTAYLNGDVVLDGKALERVQPAPVERKGPATVTIFAMANAMWTHRSVYCGTVALAKLPRSTYLRIQLPPGTYFFRSEDEQVVEVLLKEGQEVYLQMLQMPTRNRIKGYLVQVDNDDGETGIAQLHRLVDRKVTKISDANLAELKAGPGLR